MQQFNDTSPELLRAVIDTTHICIAHLDRDMNFIFVNKSYADLDNKTPDYFPGKNHFDLYPNSENELIFRNAIKTGRPYTATAKPFEYAHSPDRGVTHWDWTVQPVKNTDGSISGLVLTLLNVTERIEALEKAKINEDKLENLISEQEEIIKQRTTELEKERNFIDTVLETQGAFVTVLDHSGHPVLCNSACETVTGYKKSELHEKAFWDLLVPPEEKPEVIKVFDELISTAQPSRSEYHWMTKEGQRRLVEWSNSVIKDNDGSVLYVVMTGIDITENRQTELLLKRAAGNLEVAQRITKIGAWEYEVTTKKLWWSDEYYSIVGLSPGSVLPSLDLYMKHVHEEDRGKAELAVEQLNTNGYKDVTLRIVTPMGDIRIVHEIAQVEFDKFGNPLMLRGTIQDITDITKAEAERNQLQRQLQQAHKMESIGQLTGGIAHDFNNILAAILGFTRLAMTRFAPHNEGTLAEYLQEIEKAGNRASSLVKQLLAFSRGDTQDLSKLNPLPIIKESIGMLRSTISPAINMHMEFKNGEYLIETNALQLQQSLINLIINSRDALNNDKGNIHVSVNSVTKTTTECVSCHKVFSGEYLSISVKDNGSGIRPDLLPRIFEPFFTTKPVGDGTGMGLAMVHGFLHSSGGHIDIDLDNEHGTEVTLFFPIVASEDIGKRKFMGRQETDASHNQSHEYKILIVDDEDSVVKYLQEFLSINCYDVDYTTSSKEALTSIKSNPKKYDLIITDQSMPEMTGEDLIKELKNLSIDTPIILCSGYSDLASNDTTNAEDNEADFYLAKPVNEDILLQAINQLLKNNQ